MKNDAIFELLSQNLLTNVLCDPVVTGLRQDDERERASAGLRTIPAIYQWVYRVSGFIIFISEKRGSRGGIVFFSSPSSFQEVCHLDIYVLLQLVTLEQLTKYRVGQ